jgi:RNase P/RNase MRP subunit p29
MKVPKRKTQLAMISVCLLFSAVVMAQVKTEKSTTHGQPTVETTVERGEVVNVSGNDLVVKMENGEIRNFPNIPDSAKVTVDGQQLSVHELKPGMKLEHTTVTTTTPQTVTTVHTVTGKVWNVNPPSSVVLRLEDGTHEKFQIPDGQKFNIDGKEVDAFHLRKGMQISATKIVTEPVDVVTRETKTTGQMPPPPTEPIQGPVLIVVHHTAPPAEVAQAQPAEPPAKELPQTATMLPLLGLLGGMMVLSGVVVLSAWSHTH